MTHTAGASPWREAAVLLLSLPLLAIPYYHGSPSFVAPEYQFFWWVGLNAVCLLGVPVLVVALVWREPLEEWGLGLGRPAIWGRYAVGLWAVMLPVLVWASRMPSLQAYYPRYAWARTSTGAFLASAAAWLVYFLAWEFFFRGFLLFALLRRHPPVVAIAVQTVPFVLMHLPKPEVEALASIVAGVVLGWMAYRGRSVVGCWLLHWACAVMLDLLIVMWPGRQGSL